MRTSGSHWKSKGSEDQYIPLFKVRMSPDVFDFGLIVVSQLVKAQAVQFRVNKSGQLRFQDRKLCGIQKAFEYGVLHTLAVVYAFLGNFAQPPASSRSFCVDVVGDQYKHDRTSLPEKRWVKFQIAAQRPGEKQSLYIGHKTPCDFFLQERMGDLLLLFGLPAAEKRLSSLVGQENGTIFLLLEVFSGQNFLVDAGEHKAVGVNGAELLHQVKCKAAAAGPGTMQKTDIRVQPDAALSGWHRGSGCVSAAPLRCGGFRPTAVPDG